MSAPVVTVRPPTGLALLLGVAALLLIGSGVSYTLVQARPGAVLGLPELGLGLIPGAGGTVSITRRIGRSRTAFLVLSGRTIDPPTALRWGLIDECLRA